MKTITICGSMKLFTEIEQMKSQLEKLGFKVYYPNVEGTATDYSKMNKQMLNKDLLTDILIK